MDHQDPAVHQDPADHQDPNEHSAIGIRVSLTLQLNLSTCDVTACRCHPVRPRTCQSLHSTLVHFMKLYFIHKVSAVHHLMYRCK